MSNPYLHRQEISKPLFTDVIWSRPQTRHTSGKLALIGGNAQGFNSVSAAYLAATESGIGTIRTLLPDSLRKIVSKLLPESEFAPSTKAGSFSAKALDSIVDLERWADGILICGELGHNSETSILIEHYLEKSNSLLTLTGDSIDIAATSPPVMLANGNLILALEMDQLQHFLTAIRYPMAAKSQMTLFQLAELLHALTQSYPWAIVTKHESQFFVAYGGEVSTTPNQNLHLLEISTSATVWRLQQPSKPFESMTSGIYASVNKSSL